jgi:hypothetical protein|uniref:hypothetical protein n=1 Tax=Cephaloticoccus sp. TaxID=1985742 RepID=UPI004049E1D0
MRIALDTNALYTTRAGVARYVRGLLTGLKELNPADIIIDELAWPVENGGGRRREWWCTSGRDF